MFLDSYKIKYPEMSDEFINDELNGEVMTKLSEKSIETLQEWNTTGTISKRKFWSLRKEVANIHYKLHLEFITSPESETYWCS